MRRPIRGSSTSATPARIRSGHSSVCRSSIVGEARTVGQFVAPVYQRLSALAQNLWWSWDSESTSLFRDLDPVLWQKCDHNPIAMLQQIELERLESRAAQLALHGRINHAYRRLQEYLKY